MIRIAIVDDKKEIRGTLKEKLDRIAGLEVLFTAVNGQDFLEQMRLARQAIIPDVVLMDLDMPIMNGIEAIAEGKARYPGTRFIVLTIFDEDDKIFNAIRNGAEGYLLKDESIGKIHEAIENTMRNEGAPMSPSIARKVLNLLNRSQITTPEKTRAIEEYDLTAREKEILMLLVEGFEYKEIAQHLFISPFTVRNTVTKIYEKLHVTSRMQAVKVVNRMKH